MALALACLAAASAAAAQELPGPNDRRSMVDGWLVESVFEGDGGRLVRLTRGGADLEVVYHADFWHGHQGPNLHVAAARQGQICSNDESRVGWSRGAEAAAIRARLLRVISECGAPQSQAAAMLAGFDSAFALAMQWESEAAAVTVAEIAAIEHYGEEMFEVALWANRQDAEDLQGFIEFGDHPCGAVARFRLQVMPPHREGPDEPVGTELVAELDDRGETATEWSVPVDYHPIAVAAEELLVDVEGQRLWIDTAGNIRPDAAGRLYPAMLPIPCPAGGPDSDYLRCGALADAMSGERRVIRYEGPCT